MTKPTLVLVHGSWHHPDHFAPIRSYLESHGYRCLSVHMPSTQSKNPSPAGLEDDSAAIDAVVKHELSTTSNDVVVVSHSYGGTASNNALEGLDPTSRRTAGHANAVVHLAFMCAIPIPRGKSLADFTPRGDGRAWFDEDAAGWRTVSEAQALRIFYHDVAEAEGKKWAGMLRPQTARAHEEATRHAAYEKIPASYLVCTEDRAMPVEGQRALMQVGEAEGARFRTETLVSSHSPFYSFMEETGRFIRRSAGEEI